MNEIIWNWNNSVFMCTLCVIYILSNSYEVCYMHGFTFHLENLSVLLRFGSIYLKKRNDGFVRNSCPGVKFMARTFRFVAGVATLVFWIGILW